MTYQLWVETRWNYVQHTVKPQFSVFQGTNHVIAINKPWLLLSLRSVLRHERHFGSWIIQIQISLWSPWRASAHLRQQNATNANERSEIGEERLSLKSWHTSYKDHKVQSHFIVLKLRWSIEPAAETRDVAPRRKDSFELSFLWWRWKVDLREWRKPK